MLCQMSWQKEKFVENQMLREWKEGCTRTYGLPIQNVLKIIAIKHTHRICELNGEMFVTTQSKKQEKII